MFSHHSLHMHTKAPQKFPAHLQNPPPKPPLELSLQWYLQNPAHSGAEGSPSLTLIISWWSPATCTFKVSSIGFHPLPVQSIPFRSASPASCGFSVVTKWKCQILWGMSFSSAISKLLNLALLSLFCLQWVPLSRKSLYKIPWCWN